MNKEVNKETSNPCTFSTVTSFAVHEISFAILKRVGSWVDSSQHSCVFCQLIGSADIYF